MTLTGETSCPNCSARVLMVRKQDDGKLLRLEPQRTDGGWLPDASGPVMVAKYVPREGTQPRDGHHAHDLRCPMTRSWIAQSQKRVREACTEPAQTGTAPFSGEFVRLPAPTMAGLRELAGAAL